jgi:hypothetical protein
MWVYLIPILSYHSDLLKITLTAVRVSQAPSLAELPFEIIERAIYTVKDIFTASGSDAWSAVLLFTGVYCVDSKTHVLLPWSPLREISKDVVSRDHLQLAKTWLLDKMASAILALDKQTRELWKTEWPLRCVLFLTKGLISYDLAFAGKLIFAKVVALRRSKGNACGCMNRQMHPIAHEWSRFQMSMKGLSTLELTSSPEFITSELGIL